MSRSSKSLLAGAAMAGLWALWRLRVSRREGRMAECHRRASELQDTFLQSVEASKMLVDQARDDGNADAASLRQTVGTLSEWLERALPEGQAVLDALRKGEGIKC